MTDALVADDFTAWEEQFPPAGGCSHPVRLRGVINAVDLATGEKATAFDSRYEPDGVIYVRCGNRRAKVCPSCSALYKRDVRELVLAGLRGGKGVPESVAEHPCVFATFTAPSFGPVHARRERNGKVLPCRPRRDASKRACPHGRDISCSARHAKDDPRLGRALCPDCYNYQAAVLFNAFAGDLWRRFITYLPRHLATLGGLTQKEFRELVKVRFVKVAEYQARGVVHFHALIRLDAAPDPAAPGSCDPPGSGWTTALLAAAVKSAAAKASALAPVGNSGHAMELRFGEQLDVRPVHGEQGNAITRDAVANYIAKYVTKAVDIPGIPDFPVRTLNDIRALRCPPHHKRMIETAWQLGHKKWAHQFGFGGHPATKSRAYAYTLGERRRERTEYRRAQRYAAGLLDPWGREITETTVLFLGSWSYVGSGIGPSGAHSMALMSADNARKN